MGALEVERLQHQVALDGERTALERNRMGQFATPAGLAREMADLGLQLLPGSDVAFLEPSVGSGAFFSALTDSLADQAGGKRLRRAVGVELDARFAAVARRLWGSSGLHVIEGDFTTWSESADCRANLVIANPPYVRHHHLDAEQKRLLVARSSAVAEARVSGLSGLYLHFIFATQRLLVADAVSLWLIPTEFMDTNYGAALRHWLASSVELIRIHRFTASDVQFDDALVSSAVVVFRNRKPAKGHTVELTFGGSLTSPRNTEVRTSQELVEEGKWTGITTGTRQPAVSGSTLGNFFSIKRGIATGSNKLFIVPREKAVELGFSERVYRPILPSSRHLASTVIDATSDGWPLVTPQLALIDCDIPEELLAERDPALWKYLNDEEWRDARSGYLIRQREPWYRQEDRPAAPFLITYMGRSSSSTSGSLRFIRNRSLATATNGYLLLYPNAQWSSVAVAQPELLDAVHDALLAITSDAIQAGGRMYGGGLQKIEPRELARLPAGPLEELLAEACSVPTLAI